MPQKRNPDAAELVRAKTGRIIGALNALLMVMKGLPLAYQKDMQEDKEGAIDALDALVAVDCGHDRHGARHDAGRRRACRRRPGRAMRPRPILPTGWCARSRCRSARRTMSPAGSSPRRRRTDVAARPAAARRHAGDRAAHHQGRCSGCFRSSVGRTAARARAAPRRRTCAGRPGAGSRRWPTSADNPATIVNTARLWSFRLRASRCGRFRRPVWLWCRAKGTLAVNRAISSLAAADCRARRHLSAALGLAGCGRKGGLDPPPGGTSWRIGGHRPAGTAQPSHAPAMPTASRFRRHGAAASRLPVDFLSTELKPRRRHASLRLSRRRAARRGGQSRRPRAGGRHAVLLLFDRDAGAALPGVRRRLRRCAARSSAMP